MEGEEAEEEKRAILYCARMDRETNEDRESSGLATDIGSQPSFKILRIAVFPAYFGS